MPRGDAEFVPLVFQVWTDKFTEEKYRMLLSGEFEITTPVKALLMEAGARGMTVVVMAGLVPTEEVFPPADVAPEGGESDQ